MAYNQAMGLSIYFLQCITIKHITCFYNLMENRSVNQNRYIVGHFIICDCLYIPRDFQKKKMIAELVELEKLEKQQF